MKHGEDLFPHSNSYSESYLIAFMLACGVKIALSPLPSVVPLR